MTEYRIILRLYGQGISQRAIAESLSCPLQHCSQGAAKGKTTFLDLALDAGNHRRGTG